MERETVVLTYGSVRRPPWRWIVILAGLVVAVYALGWWAMPRVREWRDERARRAELEYQIQKNLDESAWSIQQEHWADAQISIDRARLASCADPTIFTPAEVAADRSRIDQAQSLLQVMQEKAYQKEMTAGGAVIQQRILKGCVFNDTNAIADLNRTAENLLRDGRYSEAELTLSQVLILDPENARAAELFPNAVNEQPIDSE